jgi:IS4 transposase
MTTWDGLKQCSGGLNFYEKAVAAVGTLWIFDRGFYDFVFFKALISQGAHFITCTKSNLKYKVSNVLLKTDKVRDSIILVNGCLQPLRLIEVLYGTSWYRYLTTVVDPCILAPQVVADLYRRRWRIEEAFF